MPRVRIKKLSKAQDGGTPFNSSSVSNAEPLHDFSKPSEKVNRTLKPVARESANIEAEKGEVVISNFLGDGIPESYIVGGKRHAEGGTPLWAPENSFIFSDYKSGRKKGEKGLKINDPKILELFDIKLSKKTKKGITPAEIAKKYDLNTYKKQLLDPNSDHITQTTAEEMIGNNVDKLGLLSLVQESMKGFPDGIPHLAIPFLQARGIDQQMFLPDQEEEQMAQQDEQGQPQPMQQPMEQPMSQTAPSPEMNMAAEPMMAQSGGNLYKAQPGVGINDNMEDELLTARQRRRENRRFNRYATEHAENRFRESSEKTYWDDDKFTPLFGEEEDQSFLYAPDEKSKGLRSHLWNKYEWYRDQDNPLTDVNEEQAIWDKLKESGKFAPLAQDLNLTPKQVKEIESDMETYFEGNKDLYTDGDYNFSRKNKRKFQSSQEDDPRFQWRDKDKRYDWDTFEKDDNDWYDTEGQDPNDPTFKEGYWDQTRENWDNTLGRRPKNVFQRMKRNRDVKQLLKNPNLYPQQNNQNQGVQFNVDDQGNVSNRQSGGSLPRFQNAGQPMNEDGTPNDNYILNSSTNEWDWDPVVKIGTGTSGYRREDGKPFEKHKTFHTSDASQATDPNYDLYGSNYNPTRLSKAKEYEDRYNVLNRERLKYVGLPGQTYIDDQGDEITIDYDTRGSLIKNYDTEYGVTQASSEDWKTTNPYLDVNRSLDRLDDDDPYYKNIKDFQNFYEDIDPDAGTFYMQNLSGDKEMATYESDPTSTDWYKNKIGPRQLSTKYGYEHEVYPCPPCPGETTSQPRDANGECPCAEIEEPDDIKINKPDYEDAKFPDKEYWNQDIFRMASLAGRMPRKQDRDFVPLHFRDRDVVGLSPDQMIHGVQASEASFNDAIRSTRGSTAQKQAQMLGNTKSLPAIEKAIADTANKNVTIFDTYERDMMNQNYNEQTAKQKNLDDYLADWNTIDDNHWKRKNVWKDSMSNAYLDAESNALDTYYANMENPNFQIRPSWGGKAQYNGDWTPGQGSSSGNTPMTQEEFIKQYKDLDGDPKKLGEAWAKYVTSLNKRGNTNNNRSYNPYANRSNYPRNRRRNNYD